MLIYVYTHTYIYTCIHTYTNLSVYIVFHKQKTGIMKAMHTHVKRTRHKIFIYAYYIVPMYYKLTCAVLQRVLAQQSLTYSILSFLNV